MTDQTPEPDAAKKTAAKKTAAPRTEPAEAGRNRSPGGVWLAYDAERKDLSIDSSEIKVLRLASRSGRRACRWLFGQSIEDAIAASESRQS